MKLTRAHTRAVFAGVLSAALAAGLSVGLPAAEAEAGPAGEHPIRCEDAGTKYQTARPEDVGLDPTTLGHAVNLLSVNGSETIQVFRHNCQVATGIFDPLFQDVPGNNWSQTKTITALLAGRAVTLGKLGVDDPIDDV